MLAKTIVFFILGAKVLLFSDICKFFAYFGIREQKKRRYGCTKRSHVAIVWQEEPSMMNTCQMACQYACCSSP